MTWQEEVIRVALGQVGLIEGARNDNPFGKWYGENVGTNWNNQPYCGMFVSWSFAEAGHPLPEMQAPGYSGFASASIGRTYCHANGLIVPVPQAGDIGFAIDSKGHAYHAFLVIASNPDKSIAIVEGNVGNPQGVYAHLRTRTNAVFARVVPVVDQKKGPCWVHNLCPV